MRQRQRSYFAGIALAGIWCLLTSARPAQAQRWQRDTVLSQVLVKKLVGDPAGFLWVGTEAGVWRSDGYTLTPLAQLLPPGASRLPRGLVEGLVADPTGALWLGGEAGLYRYVPATGALRPLDLPNPAHARPEVYGLWQLPHAGGLWVSYGDNQLVSLLPTGALAPDQFRYRLPQAVRWLSADSAGSSLWALTDQARLFRLAGGRVQALPAWPGRFLLPVPDTRPQQFVSTHALYSQDSATGRLRERRRWWREGPEEGFEPLPLPGRRWELTHRGQTVQLRWSAGGGLPTVTLTTPPASPDLGTPLRYTEQRTPDGLHWAYSRGLRGCYKYRPRPRFLTALSGPGGQVYSTRQVVRLPDGRLLVSGYGPLLTQAADSPRAPLRRLFPHQQGVLRIFYGLLPLGGQGVLYAEETHNFGELDLTTGQLRDFAPATPGRPPLLNAQVLLRSRMGQVWGGARPGLYQLYPARRQVRRYATGPAAARLAGCDVRGLAEDARGHLWLATNQGLVDLEPATGTAEFYGPGQPAATRLPSLDVLCVAAAPDGTVWVGTRDQGLLCVQPGRGVVQHYTPALGLPSLTVVTLEPGLGTDWWAGTYQGLVRVQPESGRLNVFGLADGLRDAELNRQAAWRDADGTLYFGGVGGLHCLEPARVPPAPAAPRLLLSSTTRYLPGAPPDGLTQPTQPGRALALTVPPGTTYAAWHLALSDYLYPAGAHFRYQLLDDDGQVQWQAAGGPALLLPVPAPGRYTLRVRGETAQGVAARNELRLPLRVQAAWWQHPVAWVLAAALLAAGAYWQHRRRLARALREARLRTRIAADLHDEVGTLLTRVSVQAELLRGLPAELQEPALERLLRNSRAAASTMRDVVWGIDAQADSAGSLLDRMREYLHQTAAAAGWQTELTVSGLANAEALPPVVRQAVYRLFKEAVTNAVRHARQATWLRVAVRRAAGGLELTIADDGQPQPAPARPATGMGLRNMQQRAAELGGFVEAAPQAAGGFQVRVQVPLPG